MPGRTGSAAHREQWERWHSAAGGAARIVSVHGVEARIADLADVIRSKEAAGRTKDIQRLPALYEHLRARGG